MEQAESLLRYPVPIVSTGPAQSDPEPGACLPSALPLETEWPTAPAQYARSVGQVGVVLPVYNEQACIQQTFKTVLDYTRHYPNYRFIFVNDGSTDRTQAILEQQIERAGTCQVQLVAYTTRRGKGYAVQTGMAKVGLEVDYLCYLDSDLAYSLEHLEHLIAQLQGCDLAIGCRSLMRSNSSNLRLSRRIAGKVFNLLSQVLLNLRFSDMQAGLKGFRSDVAQVLFSRQQLPGFSFDVELIYLARKYGYRIGEIPARVAKSHQGKASKVKLVQDSLRMLWDLFRIRYYDLTGRYR